MKINQINLESTAEVADSENEMLFDEIIKPDQIADDNININTQLNFKNSDSRLNDNLKARLDKILQNTREKN